MRIGYTTTTVTSSPNTGYLGLAIFLLSQLDFSTMSVLDKFRKGAQKAGIQATAFMQASTTKVASGSRDFAQTFSLPGEAEKAAKILDSFLGNYLIFFPPLHCLSTSQRILNVPNRHLMLSPKLFYNGPEVST